MGIHPDMDGFKIYVNDMPPASTFEQHEHADEALLSYASTGSCTQIIASRMWLVLPSHAIWMPPGTSHATRMGPRGCRLRTVALPQPIPADLPLSPCVMVVTSLLASLVEAWGDLGESETARQNAIKALLYDEIRRAELLDFSLPRAQDPRLLRVMDMLQRDPADTRGLDDWAKLAGMSRRSFIRHFSSETGAGFSDWQRRLRLLHARQLLAEGLSVTTVALSLGYRSPSAFTAMVRRELGSTAGQLDTKRHTP